MRNVGLLLFVLLLMPPALAGDDFRVALRFEHRGDRLRAAYHYRAALRERPRLRAAQRGLERTRVTATECLKLAHHKKARERARAFAGILSLDREPKLRALVIALRNPHRDVRLPVIEALGAARDKRALRPLLRRMRVSAAGGNPQSVYIAQTTQIAYVQDFDVEVG